MSAAIAKAGNVEQSAGRFLYYPRKSPGTLRSVSRYGYAFRTKLPAPVKPFAFFPIYQNDFIFYSSKQLT